MITLDIPGLLAAFFAAMCIPSAITGFIVWNFERKITRRDKEKEDREEARRQTMIAHEQAREAFELMIVEGTSAAIALGEATARAVQRIPDAHCNGDMHSALEYATEIKRRQKRFLSEQGIRALVEAPE